MIVIARYANYTKRIAKWCYVEKEHRCGTCGREMSDMRLGSHGFLMVAFFFLEGLMKESFVRSSESPFVFDSSSDTSSTISSIWHTLRGQHQRFFGRGTNQKDSRRLPRDRVQALQRVSWRLCLNLGPCGRVSDVHSSCTWIRAGQPVSKCGKKSIRGGYTLLR